MAMCLDLCTLTFWLKQVGFFRGDQHKKMNTFCRGVNGNQESACCFHAARCLDDSMSRFYTRTRDCSGICCSQ